MIINDVVKEYVRKQQQARLEKLQELGAPDVIIAQTKKNIQNPLRIVKDRFETGKMEFSKMETRKSGFIFSFDDNPNQCIFVFSNFEFNWMLPHQIKKVR